MLPSDPVNRRRSERVRLQVAVAVWTEMPNGEQLKESAHTVVVNAHGGLLKLHTEVLPGQPLVITNEKSGMEESARVVRVEQLPGEEFAVAFEFDWPSPKFWPITFPPADWEVAS